MKAYYRLFFLVLAGFSCRNPGIWTPETVTGRPVPSPVSADWHAFINVDPDTRRFLSALARDLDVPGGIRMLHLSGKRERVLLMEGESVYPGPLARLLAPGKGWSAFESERDFSVFREDTEIEQAIFPPWPENEDREFSVCARLKSGEGTWEGTASLLGERNVWRLSTRFPLRHIRGKNCPDLADAPMVLSAGEDARLLSWILGRPSPPVSISMAPERTRIKIKDYELSLGQEKSADLLSLKEKVLYIRYERGRVRLPREVSLPARMVRLLGQFDYFEIICENKGSTEECKGEFILKE